MRRRCRARAPASFSAATQLSDPKNIIWAVEHGHQAAISIHNLCEGVPITERPPVGMNLISQKMGISEWSYHNDYNPAGAPEDGACRSDTAV